MSEIQRYENSYQLTCTCSRLQNLRKNNKRLNKDSGTAEEHTLQQLKSHQVPFFFLLFLSFEMKEPISRALKGD